MKTTEIIQPTEKSKLIAERYDNPRTLVLNTELSSNMNMLNNCNVYEAEYKIKDYGYIELFDMVVHIMLYMKSSIDTIVLYTNQEKSSLESVQAYIEGILSRHEFNGEFVVCYRKE